MWTSVWLHFYEMSIIGKSIERDGLVVAKSWGKKGKLCICLLMCLYPCLCVCAVLSLEKEMATHPSIVAWRIPMTEEPGGL